MQWPCWKTSYASTAFLSTRSAIECSPNCSSDAFSNYLRRVHNMRVHLLDRISQGTSKSPIQVTFLIMTMGGVSLGS